MRATNFGFHEKGARERFYDTPPDADPTLRRGHKNAVTGDILTPTNFFPAGLIREHTGKRMDRVPLSALAAIYVRAEGPWVQSIRDFVDIHVKPRRAEEWQKALDALPQK